MKLTDLLIENKLKDNMVDEIGKFYTVSKPKKGMTKEEMVQESTVFSPLDESNCVGVYKNRSEANRKATEALLEYEKMVKEVEEAMNEFRNAKGDIKEKRDKAKEKIQALQ